VQLSAERLLLIENWAVVIRQCGETQRNVYSSMPHSSLTPVDAMMMASIVCLLLCNDND
jgi:hypothetical protein